jgi:murein DD-endopeptidase MepM/ murein hydrolase activator NlpD
MLISVWVIVMVAILGSACQAPASLASDTRTNTPEPIPGIYPQNIHSEPLLESLSVEPKNKVKEIYTPRSVDVRTEMQTVTAVVEVTRQVNLQIDNGNEQASEFPVMESEELTYYRAQSGDTVAVVAKRFGVDPAEITSPQPIVGEGLLTAGQILLLPEDVKLWESDEKLLPDSEIVYGPSAVGFNVNEYINHEGGYLSQHEEYLRSTGWTSAADIITRVALENSINPRLLLALLEYSSGCVEGDEVGRLDEGVVLGVQAYKRKKLYGQLWWASNMLSSGYYGWRSGSLLEFELPNGEIYRPSPDTNAGSVALRYYFAQLWKENLSIQRYVGVENDILDYESWERALDTEVGLPALYQEMFGDPWEHAEKAGTLLPGGLKQPELILPFEPGRVWSYASGPHPAWQTEGAMAALDFAPAAAQGGCVESNAWVVAVADGPVVRSAHGAVVQDLDHNGQKAIISDMDERTGWAILYMHIASKDRVEEGTYLHAGDRIGHPSCEGGPATGTHLHIARKYNGEWIAADGPVPFVLDGWRAHAGEQVYKGTLTKGDLVVIASTVGTRASQLSRPSYDKAEQSTK